MEQEPREQEPIEKKTYAVICAWCGKYLGEREGLSGVSHGICPECAKKVMDEKEVKEVNKRDG